MFVTDEVRREHHIAQVVDLAVRTLAATLGIPSNEASRVLFVATGKTMTPGAVTEAVNRIRQSTKGAPLIG